jgi:hypothetical protein
MELAAFDPQLSDAQLQELGRMTVNFGYAELLLDWLLLAALNVRNQDAIRTLITPLATRRKIELLEEQVDKCFNDEAKALIKKALPLLESANSDRNQIMHGYWAQSGGEVLAYYRKDPAKSRVTAPGVTDVADAAAIATRDLYSAYYLLNDPSAHLDMNGWIPHILCPQEDGSFQVIARAVGRA